MIISWNKAPIEGVSNIFDKNKKLLKKNDAKIDELHCQSGQLKVENDFLSRKLGFLSAIGEKDMNQSHMYLVSLMDWHSRKVLSFRVSNTLDTTFCVNSERSHRSLDFKTPEEVYFGLDHPHAKVAQL